MFVIYLSIKKSNRLPIALVRKLLQNIANVNDTIVWQGLVPYPRGSLQ